MEIVKPKDFSAASNNRSKLLSLSTNRNNNHDILSSTRHRPLWSSFRIMHRESSGKKMSLQSTSRRRALLFQSSRLFKMSAKAQNRLSIPMDASQHQIIQDLRRSELMRQDSDSSTHANSESFLSPTSFSSVSSLSSCELKSCLKIKTQQESLCHTFQPSGSSEHGSSGITFTKVTVHYHGLELGDHPEVSSGAPVALGCWECSDEISVEGYEWERGNRGPQLPWKERCRIPALIRERMLLRAGVTYRSIRRRMTRMKIQKDLQLRSNLIEARNNANKIADS